MRPSPSQDNTLDRDPFHTVLLCDVINDRPCGVLGSHIPDLIFGQLRVRVLASGHSRRLNDNSLFPSVEHIFPVRSVGEMLGIAASGVVARVHNFSDCLTAVMKLESRSVGIESFLIYPKLSVPSTGCSPEPRPTLVYSSYIDPIPEVGEKHVR